MKVAQCYTHVDRAIRRTRDRAAHLNRCMIARPSHSMASLPVSIVVPAYNEGPNLDQSVRQLVSVLSALHVGYEILIVEDGSARRSVRRSNAGAS